MKIFSFFIFVCCFLFDITVSFRSSGLLRKCQNNGKPLPRLFSQKPRSILLQGKERASKSLKNPNLLRVTGGTARGTRIDCPNVYLRPMMSQVRNSLFSFLTHLGFFQREKKRVLDLYAGSGSVGLEALSRGANGVTFVDMAKECVDVALQNVRKCHFTGASVKGVLGKVDEVLADPARYQLETPYQLITLTPPYQEVIYNDLLDLLCSSSLLEENTFVALEYPLEIGCLPFIWGNNQLYGLRNRRYGRTILAIYVNKPTETFDYREVEFSDMAVMKRNPLKP
jgi:16S rRNA (guanine966-N2)-methyltransferase